MAQRAQTGPEWPRGPRMAEWAQNGPEGLEWPRIPRGPEMALRNQRAQNGQRPRIANITQNGP